MFVRVEQGGAGPSCHHAERSGTDPARSRQRVFASTRYAERVRAQRASLSACLSPPASGSGTEQSESGRRAGECFVSVEVGRGCGVECSRLKRTESGKLRDGSLRVLAHGPASEAQTRRHEHRSRSAGACAKPRSLPAPRSGRGGRALRRVHRMHSPPGIAVNEARSVSDSVLAKWSWRARSASFKTSPVRGEVVTPTARAKMRPSVETG